MESVVAVVSTLAYIVFVATLVLEKYNSIFVFLFSGMTVLLLYSLLTGTSILGDETTGSLVVDVFSFAAKSFQKNAAGVGMTLMMVTGYAVYMSHIGASTKLAYLASKPLSRIRNPYLVLSMLFIIGTLLKLVITSHAGLGMLLMAVAFPILVSLGISELSAATAVIMSGFVDWGPNDSSAIFAAEQVVGMPMMDYFLTYQGRVAACLILLLAIFLPIYLRHVDNKEKGRSTARVEKKVDDAECPAFYAILPVIPLFLVTVFSFVPGVSMDVVTANLIGLFLVFALELLLKKNRKNVTEDFKVVMKAMGNSFTGVVSILIGASLFAEAIKLLKGIAILSNLLASIQSAPLITMTLMSLITFFAGILLGSGNASWYAFGPLVPEAAMTMGISTAKIAVPMQLSSGIGRCMSPVAAVMIAVSGMLDVALTDLARRCVIPAVFMFLCNMIVSYVLV